MNRYIKLTLGGSVMLILVSVICYFWYQQETAPYQEEYTKTQQFASEYRASQKTEKSVEKVDAVERQVVDNVERKRFLQNMQQNRPIYMEDMLIPM